MPFHPSPRASQAAQSKRGFTLLQLLVVIGIIAILSAVLFGALGRASEPARRAKCDIHLKQIALALTTFRQERSRMPKDIAELVSEGYISKDMLVCPSDPTGGVRPGEAPDSYADYYVLREPRDGNDFPVIVCPFHEQDGNHGLQGFKGGSTEQFAARPAAVSGSDISGVVTITRPQGGVLALPSGNQVLQLRGGDRIKTGSGSVTIHFADTSTASIQANTELSVLQSYVDGQRGGSLYTLVRQFTGRCNYYVKPGNRFDVATPTATAGALGTRFTIDLTTSIAPNSGAMTPNVGNPAPRQETVVAVQEHTVALTTVERTIWVTPGDGPVAAHDPKNLDKPRTPRGSQEESSRKALLSPELEPTADSGNNGSGSNGSGSGNSGGNGNSGSNGNNGSNGSGNNSGNGNGSGNGNSTGH